MVSRTIFFALMFLVSTVSVASLVLAHSEATGIVKERMDQMKSMRDDIKVLGAMFSGKQDYDPALVQQLAAHIAGQSGKHITRLFPQGSLNKPSEALPEIWVDWAKFEALADSLRQAGLSLAGKASLGKADAAGAFADLAGACKTCHKAFKAD